MKYKTAFLPFIIIAAALLLPTQSGAQTRIIGGGDASMGDWPWIVSVVERKQPSSYDGHYCGGTLVGSRWVLTAAHCAEGMTPGNTDIVVGRQNLKTTQGSRIAVSAVISHPSYNRRTLENDFALVYLARAVSGSKKMKRLGTPSRSSGITRVAGWGVALDNFPEKLQEVRVPLVSDQACRSVYGRDFFAGKMFCAGETSGGKDSCQGDSGGPLVRGTGAGATLVGVVSFGVGCGEPGVPGVYARVSSAKKWIARTIAKTPARARKTSPGKDAPYRAPAPKAYINYFFDGNSDVNTREKYPFIVQFGVTANYSLAKSPELFFARGGFRPVEYCSVTSTLDCGGHDRVWTMTPSYGKRSWMVNGIVNQYCPLPRIRVEFPNGMGAGTGAVPSCADGVRSNKKTWRDGEIYSSGKITINLDN